MTAEHDPILTILIPTKNEAGRLGGTLEALAEYLDEEGLADGTQVLICDDQSDDGTAAIAEKAADRFHDLQLHQVRGPAHGKGQAIREGMLRAGGRNILFMDADMATPLRHIRGFLDAAERADVVVGVRDLGRHHPARARSLSSSLGNVLIRALVLPGLRDTQAGFKLFTRPAARAVFQRVRIPGWFFDVEALAIARRLGLRIRQERLPDWESIGEGTFLPSPGLAVRLVLDVLRIRVRLWTRAYDRPESVPMSRVG